MQSRPLHGDRHQATAEHSPHLIYTYSAAKVVITHELDVGESLIISELVEDFLNICCKVVLGIKRRSKGFSTIEQLCWA